MRQDHCYVVRLICMAKPGPLPKHNAVRVNQHSSRQNTVIRVSGKPIKPPPADRSWHKRAKLWYRRLRHDAQAALYEPSDWEIARLIGDLITDELSIPPVDRKGARLRQIFDLLKQLYCTPEARQRARIEIQRVVDNDEAPADRDGKPPSKIEELRRRAQM